MDAPDTRSISQAIRSGDWALAEQLARTQLVEFPAREDLLVSLAISLQAQRRFRDAADAYARLTNAFPGNSVHWNNYGTVLRENGALADARAAYARAIQLDDRNASAHMNLGLLLALQHDYAAGREALLDAYQRDRTSPAIRIHAARACVNCQDFNGAEDLLREWRSWLPLRDIPLQIELSNLLLLLGDAEGARLLLEDTVRSAPGHAHARLFLAHVYERMNRLDDAEALVATIGSTDGDQRLACEIDHAVAALKMRRGDAAGARELIERAGPRDDGDALHYFRLAEALDKLGEHEGAMAALARAHALQVRDLSLRNASFLRPDAPALPAVAVETTPESYRNWPQRSAPDPRGSPVFVIGFPRSGTTLLEQMLDAHPTLQSMDENPFFNRLADRLRRHDPRVLDDLGVLRQYDCDELRREYLSLVSRRIKRRWDAQLVDKNPLNMLWLPLMQRLYPAARHILAIRHPCDVILSCYMQNFRSPILIAASSTLERLARAYVSAMEIWLRHEALFRPQVLVSRYEDLVADPAAQARRIADFLEIEDAAPMLAFDRHARDKAYIGTPSYAQVIEPMNRKGLDRWRNYRFAFEPLLPILEPMLNHWGYDAGPVGSA